MSKEAMKLALEALENAEDQLAKPYNTGARYAITAMKEALAEQPAQQELVTDEENEKFSRDVSNFKGTDEAATMHALEKFLKGRMAKQPAHVQRPPADDTEGGAA